MKREEMDLLENLCEKYCKFRMLKGACAPDGCEFCPVQQMLDEIRNADTDLDGRS